MEKLSIQRHVVSIYSKIERSYCNRMCGLLLLYRTCPAPVASGGKVTCTSGSMATRPSPTLTCVPSGIRSLGRHRLNKYMARKDLGLVTSKKGGARERWKIRFPQ